MSLGTVHLVGEKNNEIEENTIAKGWKVFAFTCGWSIITLLTFLMI